VPIKPLLMAKFECGLTRAELAGGYDLRASLPSLSTMFGYLLHLARLEATPACLARVWGPDLDLHRLVATGGAAPAPPLAGSAAAAAGVSDDAGAVEGAATEDVDAATRAVRLTFEAWQAGRRATDAGTPAAAPAAGDDDGSCFALPAPFARADLAALGMRVRTLDVASAVHMFLAAEAQALSGGVDTAPGAHLAAAAGDAGQVFGDEEEATFALAQRSAVALAEREQEGQLQQVVWEKRLASGWGRGAPVAVTVAAMGPRLCGLCGLCGLHCNLVPCG
jgi:hypothetical protein